MLKISDTDLRDIIKVRRITSSRQYVCDCPFCGKENHFFIDSRTQLFHCKRCDESGNIYKILRLFDKTYLIKGGKTVEEREHIDSIRESEDNSVISEVELPVLKATTMPAGWRVLHDSNDYLLSRRINGEMCERYDIGSTKLVDRYREYVIFRIADCGKTVGWVGRYANKNVPSNRLRYCNSTGNKFSAMLYGYDEIKKGVTNTVILVEGIFDKIAVDRHLRLDESDSVKCVCTFGKKTSEAQVAKIVSKSVNRVILLYDIDAVNEIRKYSTIFEQVFDSVGVAITTKKDIDECTHDEALRVFDNVMSVYEFKNSVAKILKK